MFSYALGVVPSGRAPPGREPGRRLMDGAGRLILRCHLKIIR